MIVEVLELLEVEVKVKEMKKLKVAVGYSAPVLYLEDKQSDVAANIEADNWESHTSNRLTYALASLDERSQHIVRSRWLDDEKATLQELAEVYNVSAERIRQLEKNAMKKLKVAVGEF